MKLTPDDGGAPIDLGEEQEAPNISLGGEDQIPQAFTARLARGKEMETALDRIVATTGSQAMKGYQNASQGQSYFGFSPEMEKTLEDVGVYDKPGQFTPLRAVNKFAGDRIGPAIDALWRLNSAGLHGAAGAVAQLGKETGLQDKNGDIDLQTNQVDEAGQLAMLLAGNVSLGRLKHSPGAVDQQEIGGLPRPNTFTDASTAINAGQRMTPQVLDKLDRLWTQYGIHPAEVVNDMQRDPVLAQQVLSDNTALPEHYTQAGLTMSQVNTRYMMDVEGMQTRRLPNGEVVPTTGEIGSHLEAFGREAGFRFQIGPAISSDMAGMTGREAGPMFQAVIYLIGNRNKTLAHVFMSDNPDYQMREWYGLSKADVMYHEVGHALDYFVLKRGSRDAFIKQPLPTGDLFNEMTETQKRWSPKLTASYSDYKANPSELMADNIAAYLSNPEIRKSMPLFTKLYGKLLDKYKDIAERTLPRKVEGEWVGRKEEPETDFERNERLSDVKSLKGIGDGGRGGPPAPPGWFEHPDMQPHPSEPELDAAREHIDSRLSIDESNAKPKQTFSDFYTNFVDRFNPAAKAVQDAAVKPSMAADDPYKMLRLFADWAGTAQNFIWKRMTNFHTFDTIGPGLKDILAPVKNDLPEFRRFIVAARGLELENRGIASGFDPRALRQFGTPAYVAKYGPVMEKLVKFQDQLSAYLRDSGVLNNEAYEQMLEANKLYVPFHRVLEDPEFFEHIGIGRNNMQAWNPIKPIAGSVLKTIDPLESIVRNTYLLTALAKKNEVGTKLIDMLLRTGAGEKGEIPNLPVPIGDAAEAGRLLMPPNMQNRGFMNMDALAKLLADSKTSAGTDTISIYRNGIRETYRVGDDLATMMKGLDGETAGFVEKMMRPFANSLRAGAVLDPAFQIRHTLRDFVYAFVTTGKGIFTPIDMISGWVSGLARDKSYWDWRLAGGGHTTYSSLDRDYLQMDLHAITEQTGLFTRSINTIIDPNATWLQKGGAVLGLPYQPISRYVVHPLQGFTELALSASHLGAFKKAMAQMDAVDAAAAGSRVPPRSLVPIETGGLPAKGTLMPGKSGPLFRNTDSAGKRQLLEAGWISRDTAVDAARMGAKMKTFNQVAAFSNIAIQDSDRIVQAIRENPVRTLSFLAASITLPSLTLWALNHNDSRYQSLPGWEKDAFWIVLTDKWEAPDPVEAGNILMGNESRPRDQIRIQDGNLEVNNGHIFRLPKPFQAGVIFGSLPERLLEEFYTHKPDAFKGFMSSILTAGGGDTMDPNALQPIFDQATNRNNFTGRTLIPAHAEGQLPEYQYTPYTSDTAKTLARVVGAFPGMEDRAIEGGPMGGVAHALTSPALIDNYIRAWTGNLGQYAVQAADYGLQKTGVTPVPNGPPATLADIPVIKAFVSRYPSGNTQQVQDFYDAYDKAKVYHDTLLAQAKGGNVEATHKLSDNAQQSVYASLEGSYKALTNEMMVIRYVNQSPTIRPYEKRQLLDSLYFGVIKTAEQGSTILQKLNK